VIVLIPDEAGAAYHNYFHRLHSSAELRRLLGLLTHPPFTTVSIPSAEVTACITLGVIRKLISLWTPGGDSREI
jgi:hypothetical protein